MPLRRDRRTIVAVAVVLFLVGFSYGVYQSFTAMQGTRSLDRMQHDQISPSDLGQHDVAGVEGQFDDSNLLTYWSGDQEPAVEGGLPIGHGETLDPWESVLQPSEDVFYLGVYQGRVAVFEGTPSEGRLFRVTDRRLDTLPPGEASLLRSGIRVEGESEMLQALEGYLQ
jgi:hypothetical protein